MRCQPDSKYQVYNWLKNKHTCLLCDERTDTPIALCTHCEADLPWLQGHCRVCALPLPGHGLVCGACQQKPPAFERVEAPWRYGFPVDTLITRFKHQAKWPLGRLLGTLLARHLQHAFDEGLPKPDHLLPVPLADARQRRRGFNQAEMLGQWLSDELHLPLQPRWIRRTSDTPAQQRLDAAARQKNLRHAFAVLDSDALRGQHLALVDDVLTTGATANMIARLLKKAGARRVDVYCLARTPRPGDD